MRGRRSFLGMLIGLAAVVLMLLAYGWFDAGREPLRPIVVTLPVPEMPK